MNFIKILSHKIIRSFYNKLYYDQSGLAIIEFAFSMPILIGLGMYGTETANFAMANMKVSQTALNLADNASRLGQTDDATATPVIAESDILQVLHGAKIGSDGINLVNNGRIILTSLEVNGTQQFTRWQRCKGLRNVATSYDDDKNNDNVVDPSFTGMGKTGSLVKASTGSAVMFVEVEYVYRGLFDDMFIGRRVLRQEAAFNIRDDRDLSNGLYNDVGTKRATCDKFDAV